MKQGVSVSETLGRTVALYEKILEAVPGGVVYVAYNGNLLLANEPAQAFLGLRLDAEAKQYVADFATETFHDDGSPCPIEDYPVAVCLATGEPQPPCVIGVRHPSGEIRWAVFTALPFDPGDGNPPGAVVSFVDITQRKRAENQVRVLQAELAQRERLATVGTLAAAVAHEVNNPLAFIFLGIENMRHVLEQQATVDRAQLLEELTDLQTGGIRVRDIVRDLMTFAKIRDSSDELSDLNETIKTAVRLAAPELRYRAQVVFDLRATGKIAAAGRLSQVILNLLLNAGRSLTTSTSDERIHVTSQDIDDDVVIDVIDSGPGIDLDIADRIFDPFFTTRRDGTGLGLAISRSLIEEMGGTLDLVEHGSPGACFRITLPRAQMTVEPDAGASAVVGNAVHAVLLIDDEEVIRRLCQVSLGTQYNVSTAGSVADGIERLGAEAFDLVVCDTMLLDGSGIEVYRWLVDHRPALGERFLFITGGTFTPEVADFFESHEVPVLRKPFGRAELQKQVASLLGRAG